MNRIYDKDVIKEKILFMYDNEVCSLDMQCQVAFLKYNLVAELVWYDC